MIIPIRRHTRERLLQSLSVPLLLLCFVSGCEGGAIGLVREIEAARGDCDAEALRRSDESCVQMMEQYAGMGTDLVHTYLGGLRALDRALERMPVAAFDTVGFGRAVSPELLPGLDPTIAPTGIRAVPPLPPTAQSQASNRALAWAHSRDQARVPSRTRGNPIDAERGHTSPRFDERLNRSLNPFGYGWNRWGVGPVDPYGSTRSRGYSGYRRPYSTYRPPVETLRGYGPGFGFGDSYSYGYGPAYGFDGSYGRGYDYGYDRRYGATPPVWRGRSGYGYEPAWGPLGPGLRYRGGPDYYGYDFGYDAPYDPSFYGPGAYGSPYVGYDPYFGSGYGRDWRDDRYYEDAHRRAPRSNNAYGRSAYDGPIDGWSGSPDRYPYDAYGNGAYDGYGPSGYSDRPPAEDWGYNGYDDAGGEASVPARAEVTAPRHAPGILLPPHERLRRPWLED